MINEELYGDENAVIEDRLVQLEDMLRDMLIIHNAQVLAATNQKMALVKAGQPFTYQQGILDVCEQVGNVLEGKTRFYEFTENVKAQMRKEREAQGIPTVDVV